MLLKSKAFIFLLVVLAFVFLLVMLGRRGGEGPALVLDSFAQCLTEKGAVMYGADWCPHCQNEKKAFGGAFQHVAYVECPDEPKRCLAAGVKGYPTWIFSDGRKLEGEQGLVKLSQESGCPLERSN